MATSKRAARPRGRAGRAAGLTLLSTAAWLAGCAPEAPPAVPQASAQPAPQLSAPPPVPPATSAAASGYAGHGAQSVSPEVLARFAPKPLPGEVSRRIQSMLDVRAPAGGVIAPDGKSLFFGWSVTGVGQVWKLDGPRRFPVQLTGGEDATTVAATTPDGSELVIVRDRAGEENPGLYLQKPEGGPLTLIQHKPGVQTFFQFVSDDSRWVYYRSNDVSKDSFVIYRYDRTAKKAEVVMNEPGLWSISDFRPDGRLLLSKAVGANMAEIFELAPGEKAPKPLFGQGEREEYVVAYAAQNGEVLVRTPKFGEYRRIYRYKVPAAPAAKPLELAQLTPATPELKFDVTNFTQDRKRQRLLFQVNEGGYTRLRGLDAKTYQPLQMPALPEGDHQVVGATSHDGRFTVFTVETSKSPNRSFVVEWGSKKLTEWVVSSAPEIDTSKFSAAQITSYPARDGTQIPMLVRRPEKCAEPCPVVVNFHGGPESQSRPGFNVRAQLFVDAGFVYAEPNVRGSDGYGKTWIHADDGAKRLAVITDIEDASKHIRSAWAKDGKAPKLGVFGGSYGGYSVQVAMTIFAGAYDAGVSIVGISDLQTFLRNTAPYRRILRASEYGDLEKDAEALRKLSPIHFVDRVKGPMLLVQGASDPRVPVGEALQIFNALSARKVPVELMIFPDEGHGAQKRGNQVLQFGHAVRFFEQHLRGTPAPAPN